MSDVRQIASGIEAAGIVAVIRLQDGSRLRAVVDALVAGGVRALEITMTVPHALVLIERIAPVLPAECLLGAGTVLTEEQAVRAAGAGARFVVSPVFRPSVVEAAHKSGAAAVPGCFSPTEILSAWDGGADIVKVFPATALGPSYVRDVRGPLPQVSLMPTGGVSLQNAGEWIAAGAAAIGVGSALVDAKAVEAGEYDVIHRRAVQFVDAVTAARAGVPV